MVRRMSIMASKKRASPRVLTMKKTSLRMIQIPPASELAPETVCNRRSPSLGKANNKLTPKVKGDNKFARSRECSSEVTSAGRVRRAPERYEATSSQNLQGPTNRKVKVDKTNCSVEFPVEAILGIQRESGNSYQFLVKWEGYDEEHNNWEPEKNIRLCKLNILKFLDEVREHMSTFPG